MTGSLTKYIYLVEGDKRLSRFDIWVKSSCENMEELLDVARYGSPAVGYKAGLKEARIWVEVLNTSPGDVVPVVVMVGNLGTDPSSIIILELNDRLERSGVDLKTCPPFHIEAVTVATSEGRESIWMKCVMANRGSAITLQEKFAKIATPGSRARYLVTRDYHFVPLSYPATENSDRVLKAAISRHREFTRSTIKTAISGFKDIDPFYEVPATIRDGTGVMVGNEKTMAEIILLEKYHDDRGITASPVIRVTTNASRTKLYLTALIVDAEILIRYTTMLLYRIEPCFSKKGQHIQCEVAEANQRIAPTKEGGASQQSFDQDTTPDDWEERMDTIVVEKGVAGCDLAEGSSIRDELHNLKQVVVDQQAQMKEMHGLVRLLLTKIEETKQTKPDDMVGTIMTMVETQLQSSLSSISALAMSKCTVQMEEQKHMVVEHLLEASQQMTSICTSVNESEVRQEAVLSEAKILAQDMKDSHDTLADLIKENTKSSRKMLEQLDADKPATRKGQIAHFFKSRNLITSPI